MLSDRGIQESAISKSLKCRRRVDRAAIDQTPAPRAFKMCQRLEESGSCARLPGSQPPRRAPLLGVAKLKNLRSRDRQSPDSSRCASVLKSLGLARLSQALNPREELLFWAPRRSRDRQSAGVESIASRSIRRRHPESSSCVRAFESGSLKGLSQRTSRPLAHRLVHWAAVDQESRKQS